MENVSFAVQHHPARGELLRPLIAALTPGPPPQVIFDPEPDSPLRSPWRCYRRCMEEAPGWSSHRLILQDDAHVCRDFSLAARHAIHARPDAVVVFCVLGAPHRWRSKVIHANGHWAELDVATYPNWIPVVAVSWPTPLLARALSWVDEQNWPVGFTSDDEIVGRICGALGFPVWATVPSLVDHPDLVQSSVGRRSAMGGKNAYRVAPCFIDDGCDATSIDWN